MFWVTSFAYENKNSIKFKLAKLCKNIVGIAVYETYLYLVAISVTITACDIKQA